MKSKIVYTIVNSEEELHQILQLQQINLSSKIGDQEKEKEGFVTVEHSFDVLQKMNVVQPHIIAKDGEKVVGYALSMTKDFADQVPVLTSLFKKIDTLLSKHQTYIVMGQICVDKLYRRQGVFRGLYTEMRKQLMPSYDLLITEVATKNKRSLEAHRTIGFTTMVTYEHHGAEWNTIQWDWKM